MNNANINVNLINMFKSKKIKTEGEFPSGHPFNKYKINYNDLYKEENKSEEEDSPTIEDDEQSIDETDNINNEEPLEEDVCHDEEEDNTNNFFINEESSEKTNDVKNNNVDEKKKDKARFSLFENHKKRTMSGYYEIQKNVLDLMETNKKVLMKIGRFNQTLTKDDYYVRNKTQALEKILAFVLEEVSRLQIKRDK